uniref:Uncharacterized protein n=1 Tax=Cucumis melo TaxID=3656 RepID=A0A9I9EM18_CUCME
MVPAKKQSEMSAEYKGKEKENCNTSRTACFISFSSSSPICISTSRKEPRLQSLKPADFFENFTSKTQHQILQE